MNVPDYATIRAVLMDTEQADKDQYWDQMSPPRLVFLHHGPSTDNEFLFAPVNIDLCCPAHAQDFANEFANDPDPEIEGLAVHLWSHDCVGMCLAVQSRISAVQTTLDAVADDPAHLDRIRMQADAAEPLYQRRLLALDINANIYFVGRIQGQEVQAPKSPGDFAVHDFSLEVMRTILLRVVSHFPDGGEHIQRLTDLMLDSADDVETRMQYRIQHHSRR